MDQYNNQPKNNELQEIDLVDLAVVIWQRKIIIIGATVLGIVLAMYMIVNRTQVQKVSAVFFVGEAAVVTEEVSLAEALAGNKEGVIATELLMELDQSSDLLDSIYLPRAISEQLVNTVGEYLEFSTNVNIEAGSGELDGKSQMSQNIIRISATSKEEFVTDFKKIIDTALADLVESHNKIYQRHQSLTKRQIAEKELELQLHSDARAIAIGKQSLLGRQLSNQISQVEHKDEELNRRIDLKLQRAVVAAENAITEWNHQRSILASNRQIDRTKESNIRKNNAATRTIVNTRAGIERENVTLARLDALVEHQVGLRMELVANLKTVMVDRNNLHMELGSKNNTSTLITEAINAIDSRIIRYETKISEIDQKLLVDLPANRLLIEDKIESLNRQLAAQEEDLALAIQAQKYDLSVLGQDLAILIQDWNVKLIELEDTLAIAKQEQKVSKLNRKYTQEKLDNETEAIKTAFSGHEASHEAKNLRLESQIAGLQVVLEQSTRSVVLENATARPEKSRSAILIGMVIVMFFGAVGLFFAFFFELLDKAKIRIAESN